ncbi:MAG TPA: hypothetical protein VH482_27425 [Thermomicrobiales bacterium]|jgi:hypothetical protein
MTTVKGVSIPRRSYKGPITGIEYKQSRVLGRISRTPNANEQRWLDAIEEVQTDLADLLPLSPRAYAYRIAGKPGFTKIIATGKTGVGEFLTLARRAGWIDSDTVDDSKTRTLHVPEDLTPEALDDRLKRVAGGWERWRRLGQLWVPEIWVEAVGSMRSVAVPAAAYGAAIVSSGGTNSLAEIEKLTARAVDRLMKHRMRTVVMLIGDFDPKGLERLDRTIADVWALLRDDHGFTDAQARYLVRPEWVAITPAQIADPALALLPSDAAGTKFEMEAMNPADLRDILTAKLRQYTHTKLLNRVVAASQAEGEVRVRRLDAS